MEQRNKIQLVTQYINLNISVFSKYLYLLYITISINKTLFLTFTININSNNILIESNSNKGVFSRLKSRLRGKLKDSNKRIKLQKY